MENDLKNSLRNLHKNLSSVKDMDESSRESLRVIKEDIEKILEGKKHEVEESNLAKNLKQSAEKFEATHPELAESMHIVIHTLSNMGI